MRTGTRSVCDGFDGHDLQATEPRPSPVGTSIEDLPHLRPSVHVAEEVGTRLGEREVLFGSLPFVGEVSRLRSSERCNSVDGYSFDAEPMKRNENSRIA